MDTKASLRIAIIGTRFTGRAHSNAYCPLRRRMIGDAVLKTSRAGTWEANPES